MPGDIIPKPIPEPIMPKPWPIGPDATADMSIKATFTAAAVFGGRRSDEGDRGDRATQPVLSRGVS